jgi:beta-galactosidase
MLETPLRKRIDLSDGWEFIRGRVSRRWMAGHGRKGETVDLPHCWNRGDTFQHGRFSYSGRGAYRRALELPDAPEGPGCWRLRSEGFYGFGDIWIDGRSIARFDGQYLGFDKTLPDSLPAGPHVLTVRLDNLAQKNVLPGRRNPDFLLYGGLAGRMWLEWVPALHIDAVSVEVICERGPEGAEILELRCGILGLEAPPDNLRLYWIITAANGEQIAAAGPAPVNVGTVTTSTMILSPGCWSPDNPQLYWAEGRLETDDGTVDVVRVRFGMTRAEFRPDQGFFLDGERVDLHGCNRHESIPGLGNALPEELHRADARLLKDYGCNFVRLSHYPQHPAFLDACDELGILVYAEIATWKSVSSSRGWRRAARRQMRDLILRDRHHPSVILWGMGNESRSRTSYLELREIARELDPTRPVTYAENHLYRARREKTLGIADVWSVNYELEVLEEARDACRLLNVIASECCNFPHSTRGDDGAELTQVATLEYEWRILTDRPYVAGHAVWSFCDYATEYRKRHRRQTGLFDAWRQPKMAAELFRARYADEPFISLFVTGSGQIRILHVFTNCHRLRLTRDDASPIELANNLHHVLDLEGSFARLQVKGTRGNVTVRDSLDAWSRAAAVVISIDEAELKPGRTIAVDLTICDDAGTPVRDWNGDVTLSVDGDAQLRTYTDAGEVMVSRGEGRAYLQLGRSGGEVVIRASADGLEPGSTIISPVE